MANELILAFDFGTSGVKSCIFDTQGNFLAEGYDTYQTHYPQAGYVEHDPNDWWEAMKTATRKVLAASGVQPAQIKAMSFSSHGMGAIPVDADGNEVAFPADTVVMAAGMRPDQAEVDRLTALVPEHYVVGDAFRARQIGQATRDAVNAVVDLGL